METKIVNYSSLRYADLYKAVKTGKILKIMEINEDKIKVLVLAPKSDFVTFIETWEFLEGIKSERLKLIPRAI